ncbi:phosphatidylinositol N-acetylglucosaminyltransferase subunit C-like [Centruroides sculpturatus]|uniref:phosphatidylinositol N-acetylglucosaminyltransferase subunit C-like n=1 Tax=Centruroides sculpturatus TaxID=218467 RepID=UPI000C6E0818|nr:phosphatidylinositol N-acetylglucosaminyltransferase subunit C-like [Centruroides sculpturatus]
MGRKKSNTNQKREWKKVLYEKQGVADHYVDDSFLSELKKNVNLRCYTLTEALVAMTIVTQEISCTFIFVMIFVYLDYGIITPITTLFGVGITTFLSYILYIIIEWKISFKFKTISKIFSECKSFMIFLIFGYGLSPILKTLTETISTDTIYAMVTCTMITHIVFQDYGADAAIVSSTLSLNAAIFGAVCLASRLPSTTHAFTLLTSAAGIFVLAPFMRKTIQKVSLKLQTIVSIILTIIALIAIGSISYICAILFILLIFFINFICPAGFIYCQKYKENIYGPWDEAVIKDS